jgi:NADH dehydrogenase
MSSAASTSSRRTVAVTGATGFVGRHIVAELTRRGHAVRALTRSPGAADALPISGVSIVEGDIFDRDAMSLLAAGADTMIHLVGIRREVGGQTFERLHVEATRRALDASRHAGASRYLQMSALGADPDGVTGYQRTKFAAERLVRASGLDWTIFRPSIIHGHDGEFVQMVKGWATGRKAPWFVMPYFTRLDVGIDKPPFPPPSPEIPLAQPVFVDDVARAFADAMDRPDSIGEVIALGGPDAMTWPDMLKTLRDAMPLAKKSIRPVGLPAPVAIAQARAAALLGFGDALPYSVSDAQMGSQDNVCALDKARATLGYEPRSFAETVEAYGDRV